MYWLPENNIAKIYYEVAFSTEANNHGYNNTTFINHCYLGILGRARESSETYHLDRLNNGTATRYQIVRDFCNSTESTLIANAWGFNMSLPDNDPGSVTPQSHEHYYDRKSTYYNQTYHRTYCSCGASKLFTHGYGNSNVCAQCSCRRGGDF